tara:strand:- start:279 stop:722 length:444 start_codon:yes stop_codon:yes gene_type:complete
MLSGGGTAVADPAVKVVNFTAAWCSNCAVFDPRLHEAMERHSPEDIQSITVDLTGLRGSPDQKSQTIADAKALLVQNNAYYLWEWYGGYTGLAAMISADNGEPLYCANRALTTDQISDRLKFATLLARRAPAGRRRPDGPDCPAPLR